MTLPKKIYIYPTMGDGLVRTWFDFPMTKDSLPYFSEQAVREILKQVVNDANTLIDISTTVHKTKLDADSYIPHIIELLMKGGEK